MCLGPSKNIQEKKKTIPASIIQEKKFSDNKTEIKNTVSQPKQISKKAAFTNESDEEEVPIKEKKIEVKLNLPTPAEAFNKKKEEWARLPVSQLTNNQKQKKENKVAKANPNVNAGFTQSKTQKPAQFIQNEVTEVKILPPKAETLPKNKSSEVTKQPPLISNAYLSTFIKQNPSQANQPKQNSGYSQSYSQEKNDEYPPFKIPIYEPNLLQSVAKTELQSDNKENFEGFLEINISKLKQMWEKESAMLLKVDDIMKYKSVVFSPKKMAPVISKWREGKVIDIKKNLLIVKRTDFVPTQTEELEEGEEPEEEESEEEEIYLHQFDSLRISGKSLDGARKKKFEELGKEEKPKELEKKLEEKKKRLLNLQKEYEESEQNSNQDAVDYKLKRIGNQVSSPLSLFDFLIFN